MLHSFPWTSFWSVLLAAGLLWEQARQATAVDAGRGVCCETRFITTVRSSSYVLSVLLGCPLECALVSLPRSPWQNISWNTAAAVVLFAESQSSSAFTLPLFYPCPPKCTLDLWWTFLDRNGGVLSGMPLTTDLLLAPFSEVHDAAVALLLCSTGSEDWC